VERLRSDAVAPDAAMIEGHAALCGGLRLAGKSSPNTRRLGST
jgi:hypothetical protein